MREDYLSTLVVAFLAGLLLFVFPILNMYQSQDDTTKILALKETTKFVDSVRALGYITPNMYKEFARKLDSTTNAFKINMEVEHPSDNPVYDNTNTFTGDSKVEFTSHFNDEINSTLFGDTSKPLKERTYYLYKDDYFTVTIYNINKTMATRIENILYNTALGSKTIYVEYGGMVRNEDY